MRNLLKDTENGIFETNCSKVEKKRGYSDNLLIQGTKKNNQFGFVQVSNNIANECNGFKEIEKCKE